MKPRARLLPLSALVSLFAHPTLSARADDVANFYAGKTVSIVVGLEVGGLYSTFATMLARHFGSNIPGRPNVIIQHMPGAGGTIAVNHTYTVAPKDGTILLTSNAGLPLRVPLGLDKPTYDPAKFTWIGAWGEGINTVTLRRDIAPVATLEEARTREVILGAVSKSSNTYLIPALMNNILGTKFRIITGFRGGAPIRLAMEKNEVHGWSGQLDGWKLLHPEWVRTGNLTHLVQLASKPSPDLPDVPLISSFARDPGERILLQAIESGIADRAMMVAPGVPPDRVAALARAYMHTLRSPAFLKEAHAARFEIDPIPGEKIQSFVTGITALPTETIARIKKAMELE